MPRPLQIAILVVVALAIILTGVYGIQWLKSSLLGESREVRIVFHSAFIDDDVLEPKSKQSVSRIVVEMEIHFPYASAPDTLSDLSVRDTKEEQEEVNWGSAPVERVPIEDRNIVKFVIREAFFPTDFRAGTLRNKNGVLCAFKMPTIPFNPPANSK